MPIFDVHSFSERLAAYALISILNPNSRNHKVSVYCKLDDLAVANVHVSKGRTLLPVFDICPNIPVRHVTAIDIFGTGSLPLVAVHKTREDRFGPLVRVHKALGLGPLDIAPSPKTPGHRPLQRVVNA